MTQRFKDADTHHKIHTMADASNGQTSKVKNAAVSQKRDLKNKGKAPKDAQSLNGAQGSDNREIERSTEDLVNKIDKLNVNIEEYQTLIKTKTKERNDMGEKIKKKQNKKTKTGTKIEELEGKKGELVGKKGKLRQEIKDLDFNLEKLVEESRELGHDITKLEEDKIRTETEITTMNKEETALVVEKGELAKQLDEKMKMTFAILEKGKQQLFEENQELKKHEEDMVAQIVELRKQLVDKEEETRLEKEKTRLEKQKTKLEKNKLQALQKKYDRRCCSCW